LSFRHQLTARRISSHGGALKLRVGESRKFKGWLSSNYQVFTRNFLDATKPFGNGICAYIFADNVIEHLSYDKGEYLIRNCYSALKPGGMIRITTPNLGEIVHRYMNKSENDLIDFSRDLESHRLEVKTFPDLLRTTFTAFGHHKGFIYDQETLTKLLEECGFREVSFHRPCESLNPDLRNLESRSSSSDLWSQMAIEAKKPN